MPSSWVPRIRESITVNLVLTSVYSRSLPDSSPGHDASSLGNRGLAFAALPVERHPQHLRPSGKLPLQRCPWGRPPWAGRTQLTSWPTCCRGLSPAGHQDKTCGVYVGEGLPPIPLKLADKIRRSEFTDMAEMLPEFWPTARLDEGDAKKGGSRKLKQVTDFQTWLAMLCSLLQHPG